MSEMGYQPGLAGYNTAQFGLGTLPYGLRMMLFFEKQRVQWLSDNYYRFSVDGHWAESRLELDLGFQPGITRRSVKNFRPSTNPTVGKVVWKVYRLNRNVGVENIHYGRRGAHQLEQFEPSSGIVAGNPWELGTYYLRNWTLPEPQRGVVEQASAHILESLPLFPLHIETDDDLTYIEIEDGTGVYRVGA